MAQVHQHTVELGAALCFRYVFQGRQQGLHVVGIGSIGAGIAGRAHTGLATKGIHCQPAVIRQCGQTGFPGGMAGFENGVLHKGDRRFFSFTHAQRALGNGLKPEWAEQVGQFGNLALVVTGDDEFL